MVRKKYVLLLFISCFITSCDKTAEDTFIEDNTTVIVDEKQKTETIVQNEWIFNQMNDQYYWYKDIPDTAKLNFTNPAQSFFKSLLSEKDRFSWIELNATYSKSSFYANYGFEYITYITNNGSALNRIALVLPGSPAEKAGLKRGNWFRSLLETETAGISFEMVQYDFKQNALSFKQTVTVLPELIPEHTLAVSLDTIYTLSNKKTGYLVYNQFMDGTGLLLNPFREELNRIFFNFKQAGINSFIIDLRYNPGGYVSICQYLCALLLPDQYLGQTSGFHEFNDKLAEEQYLKTGSKEEVIKFPEKEVISGNNITLDKIYVLISDNTASASESLINTLEPFIEVVTIGTTTCGKGVGSWTIQDNKYRWQIQPITFRYYNKDHKTVPNTGLVPDIIANDKEQAIYYELGDTREYLLNIALTQITGIETKSYSGNSDDKLTIKPQNSIIAQYGRLHGMIDDRKMK